MIYLTSFKTYISYFLFAAFAFESCNTQPNSKVNPTTDFLAVDSSKIYIDSAKSLLIQANKFVEKGIKGEMNTKRVNQAINPIMAKYFSVFKKLKPEDSLVVYQFRLQKVNEIIDLQIKYAK